MSVTTAKILSPDPRPGQGEVMRRSLLPNEYQVYSLGAAFEKLINIIEKGGTSGSPATGRSSVGKEGR